MHLLSIVIMLKKITIKILILIIFFIIFHSIWQLFYGIKTGKSIQESIPVIEKPVADFSRFLAEKLTFWIKEMRVSTPLGDFSSKRTISYIVYEWIKLPLILILTTFGMNLLRLSLNKNNLQKLITQNNLKGAVAGAIMGMLTPVCSCTVTNIYIGLVAGGASQKASAAFLFASPALNEFAIIFMFVFGGFFGGIAYIFFGFIASLITAYISNKLGLVPKNILFRIKGFSIKNKKTSSSSVLEKAFDETMIIFKRLIFPILISGLLAGLLVNFNLTLIEIMKKVNFQWWGPILATLAGLPLDINAAAMAPIIASLRNVLPLGTLVSLMMATTVASIPEVSMLFKIIGRKYTLRVVFWYGFYTMLIGLIINFYVLMI